MPLICGAMSRTSRWTGHAALAAILASLGLARYLSGDAAGAQQVWRECLLTRPKNARVEAYLAMLERAAE